MEIPILRTLPEANDSELDGFVKSPIAEKKGIIL
jgi:hypothetical protein